MADRNYVHTIRPYYDAVIAAVEAKGHGRFDEINSSELN